MKILILGINGMLGHKLGLQLNKGFKVYGTIRDNKLIYSFITKNIFTNIEVSKFRGFKSIIKKIHPDIVINCIGLIKQRKDGSSPLLNILVNSLFPHQLSELCSKEKIRLVHFSTDCVFSGKGSMYSENDIPDGTDLYSRSKLLGEISTHDSITIRTSLIGRELNSHCGLLEWFLLNKNKKVKGFKKAIFSGFTSLEMANIIEKIIIKRPDLNGIWHIASKPISKYDLLRKINKRMNLNVELEMDEKLQCNRSLNGSAFNRETGYKPPSWDKMINQLVEDSNIYNRISKELEE
jgi:dTDP-4-dehydrorhamnose reductase